MIVAIGVIIISFILESIFSNLTNINSLFNPLFVLISLIIIYPFYNSKNNNYIIVCGLIGLVYDLVFTDTFMLNAALFLLMGIIIKIINNWLSNNPLNVSVMTVSTVILYRITAYTILLIVEYLNPNILLLLSSIYTSILLNIIYAVALYLITTYFSKKYRITKID